MTQYTISDMVISRDSADFDDALAYAYSLGERPHCLCQTEKTGEIIPMYIAKVGEGFFLKRMPGTGSDHHPDCEHYELPMGLSGKGDLDKAITEDHQSGTTDLRLDFSLAKVAMTRTIVGVSAKEKATIKVDPKKLSLRSLLHYLYEEAGFNKWSPRMEGKRKWSVIRRYILEAAQGKNAKKAPLLNKLFLPETYQPEKTAQLDVQQRQYFGQFKKQGKSQPIGIVIGEIDSIEQARYGFRLTLKHMKNKPIFFGEDVYKRLEKNFSSEISLLFEEPDRVHLLSIITFTLSESGNLNLESISLMMTDENWLPFENLDDREVTYRLVNQKRYFAKGLRYNLTKDDIIASALITDLDEPNALYVIPADADEAYRANLDRIIDENKVPATLWDIDGCVPLALPLNKKE